MLFTNKTSLVYYHPVINVISQSGFPVQVNIEHDLILNITNIQTMS